MLSYHLGNFLFVAVNLGTPLYAELSNRGRIADCEDEGCFSGRIILLFESYNVDVDSDLDLRGQLRIVTPVPLARHVSNLDYDS